MLNIRLIRSVTTSVTFQFKSDWRVTTLPELDTNFKQETHGHIGICAFRQIVTCCVKEHFEMQNNASQLIIKYIYCITYQNNQQINNEHLHTH